MCLNPLFSAYRGELYGIAFFTAFAQQYSDDTHINKWQLLIQVEEVTAKLLKNGLTPLGMDCPQADPEMENKGVKDAENWLHLSWPALLDTLIPWVEPYAVRYRRQADDATVHHDLYALVRDHEDAILNFLQAEKARPGTGLPYLQHFLTTYAPQAVVS